MLCAGASRRAASSRPLAPCRRSRARRAAAHPAICDLEYNRARVVPSAPKHSVAARVPVPDSDVSYRSKVLARVAWLSSHALSVIVHRARKTVSRPLSRNSTEFSTWRGRIALGLSRDRLEQQPATAYRFLFVCQTRNSHSREVSSSRVSTVCRWVAVSRACVSLDGRVSSRVCFPELSIEKGPHHHPTALPKTDTLSFKFVRRATGCSCERPLLVAEPPVVAGGLGLRRPLSPARATR